MMKTSIIAGAAVLSALIVPETAAAQSYGYGYAPPVRNTACERQKKDDRLAGTVVGAIAGGLIGGAIGNNVDDGDAGWRRGHRGWRGHRGHRGYYDPGNGNSDEVAAGAILGALVGGIAGNAIAADTGRDCPVATPYSYQTGGAYPQGGIPRTTDGLYGGPEVMAPPQPVYRQAPRPQPAATQYPPVYAEPEPAYEPRECRTIYRETRLPDGETIRDPVTACRDGYDGRWQVEQDDELYGY